MIPSVARAFNTQPACEDLLVLMVAVTLMRVLLT